jgi:putative membrane protein
MPGILTFVAIVFSFATLFEILSVHTGFPFGFFKHSDAFGFKVLDVPLLVGVAYCGNAYIAWMTANIMLNQADRQRNIVGLIGLPVTAAFIVSALDATYDPAGSTFAQLWVYRDAGGYFGVPLSNYFGWMLSSYVFFQAFAIFQYKRETQAVQDTLWWLLPPVLLCIYGLQQPLNLMLIPDMQITDPSGRTWQSHHLFETTTIVSIFTVIFSSVVSFFLLAQRRSEGKTE